MTISDPRPSTNAEEDFFAFPLSPAQQRMWYANRERPGNPAYNGSFRWLLEGPLDATLVERTFNEIVRRHEVLRTRFTIADGNPIQIVSPDLQLRLDVKDLRQLGAERREAEMDRACAEEACRPFDVEKDDLIRVGLLRIEDQRYILMLTMHHLVSDGWSIGLIMEELQTIYSSFAKGQQSPLPELPIQYADYVVWKQEQISSTELSHQSSYWTNKLAGYRRLEILPDFPRPAEPTTNSSIVSVLLPRNLTNALKEFSIQQGGTMFITSLSACMVLLWQYSGRKDIAIGSPLAGRNRTDVETLIGLFVNHIVLRASLEGDPTFAEFAARARDTVWEAFANQDIPFENVVKALNPGRDAFRDPFFVVNFICQREYARASEFVFEFAGTKMSTMPSKSQGALYDLNFFMVEREPGWRLSIEYNTDLYSRETAQRMLRHFQKLLESIARDPSRRLSELPTVFQFAPAGAVSNASAELVCDGQPIWDTEKLPSSTADSSEVYAMPASVAQERFWLLSKFAPGNPAFHLPACVRLSGPLSEKALEESFRILVSRHEILRTTFEEVDGKLTQIISPFSTFSLSKANLQNANGQKTDKNLEISIHEEARHPFNPQTGPLVRATLFRLDANDHVLVITLHHIIADGWSHNVFQQELWGAYEAITHEKQPDLLPLPIQYGDFTAWQGQWLASEEAQEHLKFWAKELSGPLRVLDFPTDHPSSHRISSKGGLETFLIPDDLARALKAKSKSENVTLFMLMLAGFAILVSRYSGQQDVVLGSPVANRRIETERLIGPFSGPVALRINLSEDPLLRDVLSRVRDVTLNALSHAEFPFEVLLEKLKVRSVHGRNPLFQFYIFYQTAFLQPRELHHLTVTPMPSFGLGTPFEIQMGIVERAEGIRLQLEYNADLFEQSTIHNVLTDYRGILTAILETPTRPLSDISVSVQPSSRLADMPDSSAIKSVAARNDAEKQLARIWEELLGAGPIGIHHNYFDLGGNSLLAVRLFERIQKEFNVNLPLATLFEAQTVAELAVALHDQSRSGNWTPLVPIQPAGSRPPFFCIHGGGGNVLIYRALSKRLGAEQPFYGLQSQGLDGKRALLTRIEDMAELYVQEIHRVQRHGPYFLGGYCMGGTVALEMAQQLTAKGERVALLAMFDTVDWSKVRRVSFYDKLSYQAQRLLFHSLNFHLLDFDDKIEFIEEKLKILRSRSSVWRGMLSSKLGRKSESSLLATIWKINDGAILDYVPKTYPGVITDFRPVKQYSQYLGPPMDWRALADGHEIVSLPVYPAAMLVEPFVRDLAQALSELIDHAIEKISNR